MRAARTVFVLAALLICIPAAASARPMSVTDVVRLSDKGVGDNVIIAQIQATDSRFYLDEDDILYLRDHAISNHVIEVMIATAQEEEYEEEGEYQDNDDYNGSLYLSLGYNYPWYGYDYYYASWAYPWWYFYYYPSYYYSYCSPYYYCNPGYWNTYYCGNYYYGRGYVNDYGARYQTDRRSMTASTGADRRTMSSSTDSELARSSSTSDGSHSRRSLSSSSEVARSSSTSDRYQTRSHSTSGYRSRTREAARIASRGFEGRTDARSTLRAPSSRSSHGSRSSVGTSGTRSGSRVAMNGTSVAAPQAARYYADRFAENKTDLPSAAPPAGLFPVSSKVPAPEHPLIAGNGLKDRPGTRGRP